MIAPAEFDLYEAYSDSFRTHAFQLLAWGYADARARITALSDETEVTGFIAEAIDDRIDDPRVDEVYMSFVVKDDPPIRAEDRTGRRRRRVDLILESTEVRPHPRYLFEGKRLGNGNPIGRYVGVDGLDLYIQGTYAEKYAEAAMVGYVQSHDAAYWYTRLEQAFARNQQGLAVLGPLTPSTIIQDLPHCWSSNHGRPQGNPIRMTHVFLDCT